MFDVIWSKCYDGLDRILPGKSLAVTLPDGLDDRYNYKLRVRGEVGIPFTDRTEATYPKYFRRLDDSLKEIDGGYALAFGAFNECHERSCYQLIRGIDKGEASFSLGYLAHGIGEITVSLEIYYGEQRTRYYYDVADEKHEYKLTCSGKPCNLTKVIALKERVDFIMLKISAVGYRGEAEIYSPSLVQNGREVLAPFELSQEELDGSPWIGEGFSLTERPGFRVRQDGEVIFSGRKQDRLQRLAGVEFLLNGNPSGSEVEITLDEGATFGYDVSEVQLLTLPKEFEILGVSPYQNVGEPFGVLCHFPEEGTVESFAEGIDYVGAGEVPGGTSVLEFFARKEGTARGKIIFNGTAREFSVDVFPKREDGVLTGSGDFVYINQNEDDFVEYLSWYLSEGVGNALTLRSVYRWGGTSECREEFWKSAVKLLVDLKIYYSLMVDGRELNGANASPRAELLRSPYFLGEQTHEKDGVFTYWDQTVPNKNAEALCHVFSRKMERTGNEGRFMPCYGEDGVARRYYVSDSGLSVEEAYGRFAKNIERTAKDGASRHTGVTPLFDVFLKNGYDWVGYESMYGPHELLFGAVRGITASNHGKKGFGSHLALQWSTVPADDPSHALRYRLSLYLSYMHGATEINTEEGLWNIENPFSGFDRFSDTCRAHLMEQNEFYRFVRSRERRGKLKTDIAMVMGRFDGMDCFSTGRVFGQSGSEWEYGAPEKSWELMKVFYPEADINAIYYFIVKGGRKNLTENARKFFDVSEENYRDCVDYQSLGFYSTTPYGPVDVIPASADNFGDYKFLFFTGWNTCDEDLLSRLIVFVKGGGTLLLTRPHLYDTVSRAEALSGKAMTVNSELVGQLLSLDGVIFFDEDSYPIDVPSYRKALLSCAEKFGSKHVRNARNVTFTEYALDGGERILYLLDIGWWTAEQATCTVISSKREMSLTLPKCGITVVKISKDGEIAVE